LNIFLVLRLAYLAALVAACAFAFFKGGRDERRGAAIMIAGSLLSFAVQASPLFDWHLNRAALLAVDVGVLAAFFMLAQRSDRFWPLWATAFHLIAVTTHIVMLVQPERVLQAYAIAQGFWAYPMLVALTIGSANQRHRRGLPAR